MSARPQTAGVGPPNHSEQQQFDEPFGEDNVLNEEDNEEDEGDDDVAGECDDEEESPEPGSARSLSEWQEEMQKLTIPASSLHPFYSDLSWELFHDLLCNVRGMSVF